MSLPRMEIYAFEDELERATAAWLLQNGVNDPKKQRDNPIKLEDGTPVTLKTPRVEIKFMCAGFPRELYYIVPQTSLRWLHIASGTLYLKIITRRTDSEPSHAKLRGLCRYLMQQAGEISAKMQFHIIEKILEQSSTAAFEADKLHDVSSLSFQTDIRIRPGAFPTS